MPFKNESYIDINQFLDIKDPRIAYFLGLMWADGSIQKKEGSGYRVTITLVKPDMEKIAWIFSEIGNFCRRDEKGIKGWQDTIQFYVTCKKFHSFLKENNYHNKSGGCPRSIISKIPKHLQHYWWRGFNDGDGCFYCNKKNKCYRVLLSSGHDQDWNFVEDLFKELGITGSIKYKDGINKTTGNRSREAQYMILRKEEILKFGNYIYQNVDEDRIGFDRKLVKFRSMIDWFNSPQNKGKTMVRKKVQVLDRDGNKLNEFPSLRQAAIYNNINYKYLKSAMRKIKSKTVGDITFTQIDDDSRSTNPTK